MLEIRNANIDDLDNIMRIYKIAQDFMIKNNNPTQWGYSYPSRELIQSDINLGTCKLVCLDNQIKGVFTLFKGNDPTYKYIEDGKWLNEDEYITIHRIASDGTYKGIFTFVVNYCKQISKNIRIDTHNDNLIMQKLILKNGFKKCGTIYVKDGSKRIAYQLEVK